MPLILSVLVIISTPLIVGIYNMLINIVTEHIMWTISILFSVIYFLIKLLLMIRRAKYSTVLYDKFFNFAANHYLSGILYFFILLLSIVLVYSCVWFQLCLWSQLFVIAIVFDCNCVCVCGYIISCDPPRAWWLYFQDSDVSFSCFCFIAFNEKYNTHLPINKTPPENFLTWLIGFVEGKGYSIVNNRGDLRFVITQGTMDKEVL